MDILINAVGGFIVEVGKVMCKCIYPKIENVVRFSSKIEKLRTEMGKLTEFRDDIKGKVEVAEREGYKPKPDVIQWINKVREVENEWETMHGSIAEAKKLAYKCCPNCSLRLEVSARAQDFRDKLSSLIKDGENFGSNLVIENYRMKKVEFIPGPSIQGQPAAARNLNEILRLLQDDKVRIIGVWGTGGVGKTTLVKNLNNELGKTNASSSKLSFGVVIWVTVPKPPIDIRNLQAQIASRLNLKVDNEGNVESIGSKICERLKEVKSFLLILDDVWEAIDLDDVGVPRPEDHARSKVIITSRFLGVCRQMRTDTEMKVYTLGDRESWQLFVENAGDAANLEEIQPLAKEITRECDGLPLAITVIGASMRGKKKVELWKDALKSLRMSEPHNKDVRDKVYKVIKWSVDSLESLDVEVSSEQRSRLVNKRRGDIQSCFLYCSLYPAAIRIEEVINCWWAEGFLGEHDTYEEAYDRGVTMIESLKDVCLLETHDTYSVKMHDVVRDVARWIDNSFGAENNSLFQAGFEKSQTELSASVKRISFVSSNTQRLPDFSMKCPETTSLLLQKNRTLEKISDELFLAFPALRVLNLSETSIRALPSSINGLFQLRALILKWCNGLKELPPIGNLCNLQLLDCGGTWLLSLPPGMDKLTNLRLLTMTTYALKKSIGQGFFINFSRIEMLDMWGRWLKSTSLNEISSLHNLTSLFVILDSSSIFNRDYTWMARLKTFYIEVGGTEMYSPINKSTRTIRVAKCETFSNGELSGMLQFASHLYLKVCMGVRKLIAYDSFNGLKSLDIMFCSCDFKPAEQGSGQFDDPLPNLQHLRLHYVRNLKSVSDFSRHLGLRFSKLRLLDINQCDSLTCLFTVGGAFSVPNLLEHIEIYNCREVVELFVECSCSSSVNSGIPRFGKLMLVDLPRLGKLGEPQKGMWEHLEELHVWNCYGIKKLPLSIQTSKNIKVIEGDSEWWSQLEWDDDDFKSNLEQCLRADEEPSPLYNSLHPLE